MWWTREDTPMGPVLLLVAPEGLYRSTLPGRTDDPDFLIEVEGAPERSDVGAEHRRWIRGYFDGENPGAPPPFAPRGSEFTRRVRALVATIPPGETRTYGEIARRAGSPGAARAVGTVMARNPFPLFVPCHRVIRSGGDLGEFGGGRAMKSHLLDFDRRLRVFAQGGDC